MQARELRCPGCFAPIDPSVAVSRCRYCGTTLVLEGAAVPRPRPAAVPGQLVLEDVGPSLITVIKVIREHTRLGLKEAKDLAKTAPCLVAQWDDEPRMNAFRNALIFAGARIR